MKSGQRILLLAISVFLALATSGCVTASTSPPIPADWIEVDAPNRFTLKLPPEYAEETVQGIDSYVRSFRREGVRIGIDYGRHCDPLNYENELDYQRTETTIDGRNAWWVTFTFRDSPGSMRERGFTHFAAVHIPRVHLLSPSKLTLFAFYAEENRVEDVIEIVQTIDFK